MKRPTHASRVDSVACGDSIDHQSVLLLVPPTIVEVADANTYPAYLLSLGRSAYTNLPPRQTHFVVCCSTLKGSTTSTEGEWRMVDRAVVAQSESKRRRKKAIRYLLPGIPLTIGGGLAFATAAASAPPGTSFEPVGRNGNEAFQVRVGSVIAQGEQDGDRCTFAEPFGVGGTVTGGAQPAPIIRWRVDETCQVVISQIRDPATVTSQDPPTSGATVEPQVVGTSGDGE